MAFTPTPFDPNPYANFDPSQWANPYSNFQNQAIPFPASYSGWPTNALGQPIQQPPGMTLNSSAASPAPAAPAAPAAAPAASYSAANPPPGGSMYGGDPNNPGFTYAQERAFSPGMQYQNAMAAMPGPTSGGPPGSDPGGSSLAMRDLAANQYYGATAQQPQAAAPAAAAPAANPSGLTSQQYLQLMSNPGRVNTPGATVPQSANVVQPASGSPGSPGVLQAFLQNWTPAQSGAGSQFQQQFAKALGKGSQNA